MVETGRLAVKICGITSLVDAEAALEAGADMLGFNFYHASKRYIDPTRCGEIITRLHAHGWKAIMVGVFVDTPLPMMRGIMDLCRLDLAQLSGDEPAEILEGLGGMGFKALRLKGSAGLRTAVGNYPARPLPPAYLIDAHSPGEFGGTGRTANWSLAARLSQKLPILLAGGLTPENVSQAVSRVHPWGVDVASGVEIAPGIKDHARVRGFVEQARHAAQLTGTGE